MWLLIRRYWRRDDRRLIFGDNPDTFCVFDEAAVVCLVLPCVVTGIALTAKEEFCLPRLFYQHPNSRREGTDQGNHAEDGQKKRCNRPAAMFFSYLPNIRQGQLAPCACRMLFEPIQFGLRVFDLLFPFVFAKFLRVIKLLFLP